MGRRRAPGPTRVCLEVGSTWVFATAFDWPGWCRRARSEEEALECLLGYNDRYRIVVGKEFDPGPIEMVGRSDGNRNGLRCKIRHDRPAGRCHHVVAVLPAGQCALLWRAPRHPAYRAYAQTDQHGGNVDQRAEDYESDEPSSCGFVRLIALWSLD